MRHTLLIARERKAKGFKEGIRNYEITFEPNASNLHATYSANEPYLRLKPRSTSAQDLHSCWILGTGMISIKLHCLGARRGPMPTT